MKKSIKYIYEGEIQEGMGGQYIGKDAFDFMLKKITDQMDTGKIVKVTIEVKDTDE